jgi:hypothetical protein
VVDETGAIVQRSAVDSGDSAPAEIGAQGGQMSPVDEA